MKNTIGLYGLGVMGASLAKNMLNKGERVALYNYTDDLTTQFMEQFPHEHADPYTDLSSFVQSLEKPRKIFLMVTAGDVTTSVIDSLFPLLDEGDIIMDGGNANFVDSNERYQTLREHGIHFIGVGVSGGEEGALHGPSLMPSGDKAAYAKVSPILEKIAAQVNGEPCCTYIGKEGAGHYVKMVHNGIEYADMQLITETYQFFRYVVHLSPDEIANIFEAWNETELNSYLLKITTHILRHKDEETGKPIVDIIMDRAGQKGTGKWTSMNALDLGIPSTTISEAVFVRFLSALKKERMIAKDVLQGPIKEKIQQKETAIQCAKEALLFGRVIVYTQGFMQYKVASETYGWDLQLDHIAKVFRGGCIIQSDLLHPIRDAYRKNPELTNLLLDDYFKNLVNDHQASMRAFLIEGIARGVSLPTFSAAMAFYDGYRAERSGAELIQAQRDYFGAHTYERVDREGVFHTKW